MAAPQPPAKRDPVLDYLTVRRDKLLAAIPQALKSSVTWTSIIQGIGLALEKSPKLRQCNPRTIYASVLYGLRLGLDPSGQTGEFALVPYKGACTGQVMAYGKLRLAYRFGGVRSHTVQVIHENDTYEFDQASNFLKHSWKLGQDRGKPVGAYFRHWKQNGVVDPRAGLSDGQELMDVSDFIKIRDQAKAKNNGKLSPAYRDWPDEMFKRSVISRGCKHIDKSPDLIKLMAEARAEYQEEASTPYIDVEVDASGTTAVEDEPRQIREDAPEVLDVEPEPAQRETVRVDDVEVDPETGEVVPPPSDLPGVQQQLSMPE